MKLKTITVGKVLKVNIGNYSNLEVRCDLSFEKEDGEQVNWDALWDTVNSQLENQAGHIEQSWIETQPFKDFFKIIVKVPKHNGS